MINRHQAAILLGNGQPFIGRLAEVDPADVAEDIGMPLLGGHFLARQQADAMGGGYPRKLGVVADRVVVGDRQEVQAPACSEPGQLGHRHHAIGMDGVRMQVAC